MNRLFLPRKGQPAHAAIGVPDNPILVDENGHVVPSLSRKNRTPLRQHPPVIYSGGPPTTIFRGFTPNSSTLSRIRAAHEVANTLNTSGRAAADALRVLLDRICRSVPVVPHPAPAADVSRVRTRIRRRPRLTHPNSGWHAPHDGRITDEEMYIGDARPPAHSTSPDHDCGICFNIRSHPVRYDCGHGHCYACIWQWLEVSFQCPTCHARMFAAPTRDYDTEAKIAAEHPDWSDESEVAFSFAGPRFPWPFIILDSP
ncbi:hypothetical protein B0H17DRAFT_1176411 [Mycena rosella]|uniref:RING-type domain-containing protein n=1 Tax=Mycena rosella TaxID=1033263 RepID=A0AAD7GPV0_MYCRO|nr:hypothetical protein B0H17DRAFT_1176411 [Mycena rosella]